MGIPRHTGKYLVERILFAFVVLLAAFILLGSPLFEVREIEVTGNSALPEKKIVELSGITIGTNIFRVNLKESEARIRTVPLIKDVSLTREFPSRIVIAVEERKAVALLPIKDGFMQVDREGVCLKESGVAGSLPVVTGTVVPTPAPGEVIRDAKLGTALQVINQLPGSLCSKLSEIHVNAQGQVVLYTLDGVECRLGAPVDIHKKAGVLLQVLEQVKGRQIAYVDLTGVPVVKYVR
ncbi:cell division protein FtsQ/DivIB [Desulfofundulus thermosubterraneus]|uniref:Cell division protein FtsQ n=1 Tax=Desulfofundulus thermosubterraneus DSM 16057 TaxID=1121432 RepID=A0A1M6CDV8_9FIRM|nr:FtsQ-type POTRA domain-containing protein [Desulfofundulus thermosubterraneus]SHI58944.1 cell division protein FtsQ [Desulfofundulus thermosubterraneus DSM 16057]